MDQSLALVVITAIVPALITIIKHLIPKIPTPILPILAPILGAGLDILGTYATGETASPYLGAIYGSAGVGLREIINQVRKKSKA